MISASATRVLLVAAGGTVGTAARIVLGLVVPDAGGVPLAVLVANLVGAYLLGIVAARLPRSSELRLFLGTGILGGFTTYSAFAVGTVTPWATAPLPAVGYALGSVLLGVGAAALGLRAGRPRARATDGAGA